MPRLAARSNKVSGRDDARIAKAEVHFSPKDGLFMFEVWTQEGEYSQAPLHLCMGALDMRSMSRLRC